MPPELISGIGLNRRRIDPFPADMWCLGETIFYLLTSEHTFEGIPIRLHEYCKGGPFPMEPLFHVQASDAAIRFVQELMAPDPDQRLTVEMADQHEWMELEPLPEAEQEMRETSEEREDSSIIIPEDKASARWTTASRPRSPGTASGRWDSTITEIPPRREDSSTMIPGDRASARWTTASHQQSPGMPPDRWATISHQQSPGIASGRWDSTVTEIPPSRIPKSPRNNNAGPSSSIQGPKHSTQRTSDEISPLDQSELGVQPRVEEPATVHRRAMDDKPEGGIFRFFRRTTSTKETKPPKKTKPPRRPPPPGAFRQIGPGRWVRGNAGGFL